MPLCPCPSHTLLCIEGATFPGSPDSIVPREFQPWEVLVENREADLGKGQSISSLFICILWHFLHGSSSDLARISAPAGQPPALLPILTASHSHFIGTCLVVQLYCLLYLLPFSYIKFLLVERPRGVCVSWLAELATNINITISFNCLITLSCKCYNYPHFMDEEPEAEEG